MDPMEIHQYVHNKTLGYLGQLVIHKIHYLKCSKTQSKFYEQSQNTFIITALKIQS